MQARTPLPTQGQRFMGSLIHGTLYVLFLALFFIFAVGLYWFSGGGLPPWVSRPTHQDVVQKPAGSVYLGTPESVDTPAAVLETEMHVMAAVQTLLQRLGTPPEGEIVCTPQAVTQTWSCLVGVGGIPVRFLCVDATNCTLADR